MIDNIINRKERKEIKGAAPLRHFVVFALFAATLICRAQSARTLTFTWSYTNAVTPDSFVLFSTTNLATPLANWTAIAQIVNPIGAYMYGAGGGGAASTTLSGHFSITGGNLH
jgi:hypothetical protein